MSYHRGTLAEFNTWHDTVKIAERYPKVGNVSGVPTPANQQTVAYSDAILHPTNSDDYIWQDGKYPREGETMLSESEVKALGWFPEELI